PRTRHLRLRTAFSLWNSGVPLPICHLWMLLGEMALTPMTSLAQHDPLRSWAEPSAASLIDDAAIAAVTELYREVLPPGGEILDLMSGWVSHLPAEGHYSRVV